MWQRLSVGAVVVALVLVLYQRYWWYLPGLLSHFTMTVHAHRPSLWEAQLSNGVPPTRSADSARSKPNIIFIVADDLGYNDISFYGGGIPGLKTKYIDSIGSSGIAFSNGYAGHATCAPSRAAIMTGVLLCMYIYCLFLFIRFTTALLSLHSGRYATRFGFEFTPVPLAMSKVLGGPDPNQPIHSNHYFKEREKQVPDMAGMAFPLTEKTVAEHMEEAGYHNLLVGKWVIILAIVKIL